MAHKMPPMPALAPGRKIRLAEVVAGAVPPGGSVAVVGRYVRTRSHLLSPLALPFWVSLHRLCGRRCDRADGGEGQGPSQGGGRLLTVLFFGRLLLVVYAPLPRPLCAGGGFLRSARGGVGIMVAVLLPHNPPPSSVGQLGCQPHDALLYHSHRLGRGAAGQHRGAVGRDAGHPPP